MGTVSKKDKKAADDFLDTMELTLKESLTRAAGAYDIKIRWNRNDQLIADSFAGAYFAIRHRPEPKRFLWHAVISVLMHPNPAQIHERSMAVVPKHAKAA